jgi:uncharacterized membrane protein
MADIAKVTRAALGAVSKSKSKGGPLSDPKKLGAAGVGIAALPVAVEQIAKRVAPKVSDLGGQATGKVADAASSAVSSAGEQAKEAAKGTVSKLTPGSSNQGESDDQGRSAPGQGGSGRRMPVQQSVDVAVPIRVAYNRWTMFEDWPEFMHRVESVEQVDDTTLSFATKTWGIRRRFQAKIVEQRPDQRIEWDSSEGLAHTGVVTFHKLADRLTRIEVSLDIEPHGMLEKMGRGMRFTKRAVRADLHRFKALIELDEEAEGGWRGTIEDGKVQRKTRRTSSGRASRRRSQSRNGSRRRSQSRNGSRASSSAKKSRSRSRS